MRVELEDTLIAELVDALSDIDAVRKVLLFGSLAERGEGNDVDLLIVGDFFGKLWERRMMIYDAIMHLLERIDIDIIPLTEDELKALVELEDPIIMSALKSGRVLYEKA